MWALYNGFIVYVMVGTLIVGELAWRHAVARPHSTSAG